MGWGRPKRVKNWTNKKEKKLYLFKKSFNLITKRHPPPLKAHLILSMLPYNTSMSRIDIYLVILIACNFLGMLLYIESNKKYAKVREIQKLL